MVMTKSIALTVQHWEVFHPRLRRLSILIHVSLLTYYSLHTSKYPLEKILLTSKHRLSLSARYDRQNDRPEDYHVQSGQRSRHSAIPGTVPNTRTEPEAGTSRQLPIITESPIRRLTYCSYETGRQAIHSLRQCPSPSKRPSHPRLQRPRKHDILFPRRCKIL